MRKLKLDELNRVSVSEYKVSKKNQCVVILDSLRSGLNIGSIFRTSDAFLIEKIYLTGLSAIPPHPEIFKTAIGATESVNWEYQKEILSIVLKLKEEGFKIIAIEQTDNSILLQNWTPASNQKYAIILGNEVGGVHESILESIDQAIEIPQFGTKHSLNVAVCAGIVLWHFNQAVSK
jgi:23S rRNA (guanosine2251-2'-O)-methyltransferase